MAVVALTLGAGLNLPSTFTTDFVSKGKGPAGAFSMSGIQYSSEHVQFNNGSTTTNGATYPTQLWTYYANKTSYMDLGASLGCQKFPAVVTLPMSYYNSHFVELNRACFDTKGNRPGFQWKFDDAKAKISMVLCVSKDKTTPFFGTVDVEGTSQSIMFRNFVPSVKDSSVFNLGKQCWSA